MRLQDYCHFLLIGLLAVVLGMLNGLRVDWDQESQPDTSPAVDLPKFVTGVDVERATKAWQEGTRFFVDTRSKERFEQGHVPDAISLPADNFEAAFHGLDFPLVAEMPLVLYGEDETDPSAVMVAEELRRLGFSDVQVMQAGWQGWQQRGRVP